MTTRNAVAKIYDCIGRDDIDGANRLFAQAVKDAGNGRFKPMRWSWRTGVVVAVLCVLAGLAVRQF